MDIFEKQDRGPGTLPADAAMDILPECQVAVITSTSIINNTVDGILNACCNCRDVIMLGASTPLLPEVFAHTPVTVLSGIIVTHPENILDIVSEGGGMQLFKKISAKLIASCKINHLVHGKQSCRSSIQ